MLSNIHTHTNFCDGDNTPEEIIVAAINKGFASIGFSGHTYTDFSGPFGIYDTKEYIKTIRSLKEKYKKEIEVYVGIEDDASNPVKNRKDFDFIIGSHHYIRKDSKFLAVDENYAQYLKALSLYDNVQSFAERYYGDFCDYIFKYKPTIIGHFDLITKYDEQDDNRLLSDEAYNEVAEKYLKKAIKAQSFFEINTGAMARGYRTKPYPAENLLHILNKEKAKIIITTDCHSAEKLDFSMSETADYLKDIGFKYQYVLSGGKFTKQEL